MMMRPTMLSVEYEGIIRLFRPFFNPDFPKAAFLRYSWPTARKHQGSYLSNPHLSSTDSSIALPSVGFLRLWTPTADDYGSSFTLSINSLLILFLFPPYLSSFSFLLSFPLPLSSLAFLFLFAPWRCNFL